MDAWLEERRVLVLAVIGLLLVGAILIVAIRWKPAARIEIIPPAPTATPSPIQVYVSGAVVQDGVYELPHDAIVQNAIQAAGGLGADADTEHLNLAKPLEDGEHIYVPHIGEAPMPTPTSSPSESETSISRGLININTASQAELETLPGIGPALAQRIIEYRELHGGFPTIEDLQNVSGIGPAVFEDIRDLITVE